MNLEGRMIVETIEQLVKIPSPSGHTDEAIDFCRNLLRARGIDTVKTNKGALLATMQGKDSLKHRFLTAHVDTLGAMVKEIKENGKLRISKIGDFAWNSIEGEYCNIHTMDGESWTGTILMEQASVHVHDQAEKGKRDEEHIEVRIDAKVKSKQEVQQRLGIQVGDFVSFEPRFEVTEEGFVKSRHLDDKAGLAVLLHLMDKIHMDGIELPHTTHFYISNNEEIGYGGNASIPSQTVEYLAVDIGAIGEGQTSTEYDVSICAKDTSGPYHFQLRKHLVDLARQYRLGHQVDVYPFYSSDASSAVFAGSDVRHGLIGPGIDASNSFERTHVDSLVNTLKLLKHYLQSEIV
ncbi:M42 family metallopeptidase [Sediminibacillus massiliensis]|uniref:M42 family metallopeptidase n=1 Tax=Sediminibacillus massiliensis TaxID=1926277 RepID=UPI0009888FCC|nr:M42 family metallopeptidase [Sediminibacillus massiliensis]